MKDKNKFTWEQVEAQWRGQLKQQEEPAPAFNWDQLDATNSRPIIPLWRRVTQSPWAWAAVLGLSIGLNWQNVERVETPIAEVGPVNMQVDVPTKQLVVLKVEKQANPDWHAAEVIQPVVMPQNPMKEIAVAKSVELPQETNSKENEAIFVRVDIDPIEEKSFNPVNDVAEKPVKRKRNLISQLIRQVIVGEPGGWREIANSNDKLSDGIHQVANTVIRTEQSVKQTLQIQ
jgi:hypothetical protein